MEFIHASETLASVSDDCVFAIWQPKKSCCGFPHFRNPLSIFLNASCGSIADFVAY